MSLRRRLQRLEEKTTRRPVALYEPFVWMNERGIPWPVNVPEPPRVYPPQDEPFTWIL